MKKFWSIESGSYKIDPSSLHAFLEAKGFYTFKPSQDSGPLYVRIRENKITEVSRDDIRDYCWDYINNVYQYQSLEERMQVRKEFLNSASPFSRDVLNLLQTAEIKEVKDTKDVSYIFFNDCVLIVKAEGIIKKDYKDLKGMIWENEIIPHDLKCEIPDTIDPSGEFYEFVLDITKHSNKQIQDQNRDSLVTLFGYLLHRYKDLAEPKAVIFMDSFKDGNPQGGTGKGILMQALKKVRSLAFQNGKHYKSSDRFALSNVNYGDRILFFDDVPRNFDFEKLFPTISEETVVEQKFKNKYSIPFEDSPKVVVTTNYTIEGKGSSHDRRKVEYILSDTYGSDYTPEDRFGHLLFKGWNNDEWEKFYLFMAYCLQMYLLEGIVEPQFNVAERTLKQNASPEFIKYADDNFETGVKYNKKEKYEEFLSKFPNHAKVGQNTFTKWTKLYADAYSYKVHEPHSGPESFLELVKREGKS